MTAWEIAGTLVLAMAVLGLAILCIALVIMAVLYRQMVRARRDTLNRMGAARAEIDTDVRPRRGRFRL